MGFWLLKKQIKVTKNNVDSFYTLYIPVRRTGESIPADMNAFDEQLDFSAFCTRYGIPDTMLCVGVPGSSYTEQYTALRADAGCGPVLDMSILYEADDVDFGGGVTWHSGNPYTMDMCVNGTSVAWFYKTNPGSDFGYTLVHDNRLFFFNNTFPWYDYTETDRLLSICYEIQSSENLYITFNGGKAYKRYISVNVQPGHTLKEWFDGVIPDPPDDPDPNARKWGNSEPGGGKGTRPGDSGKIVNPYAPSVDALDAGFMTAFLPTVSELNSLASYLWSNPISFESLEKLISNPFDLIIGLHMLPISIASSGTKAIKPGALVSGISAAYTDKQIVTKDFGTLKIAERWGSVLDYAPYTKISIHLPYIGTRTLNTDEVMNKTIGLKYKVDILSGACVAEIAVDGSVMYEFAGNMALDIPITAQDHRQLLATLATIGVTAAGAGLAALGGAGAVAGAGVAASEAAGATGITAATVAQVGNAAVGVVMASKPTIERTGGLGSAAGWCGVQTPYILIESPEQSLPKNYMGFNGYPCNMSFELSELTGYTQCETVRFGSAHATDPEMQEVIASLQAGVVLGGDAPTKPADPVAGIGVTLYQNASPALYVYKDITAYGAQHVCNFKQPTDIVNPTITLELSAIDFNYVYIGGSVDRYYYVTEKRSVRRGVWEVELKCDPLMSFATDILAAQAVVSRQENEWNLYLDDGTFKAYQYTNFYQEPFGTSFDTSTYVLIVAGS